VVLGVGGSSPLAHPTEGAGQKAPPTISAESSGFRCPILGAIREPILIIGTSSREQAAQHEAGHAVARWALNLPFQRITLNGPRGPVTEPDPGRLVTSLQGALIAACGAIADYQYAASRSATAK
jgi:hypothetical protein